MPGLVEMHAHLDDGLRRKLREGLAGVWDHQRADSVDQRLRRPRAARGVRRRTAARPATVHRRRSVRRGARVYYPGGVRSRPTRSSIASWIARLTLGVDFFKTYVRLPDRLQKRVVDYAHSQNQPVTSHELYPAVAYRHRRHRTSARHQPARLLAEAQRDQPRVSGRHRSDREIGRYVDADHRHRRRFRRARDRRQVAALRPASGAVPAAAGQPACGSGGSVSRSRARSADEAVRGDLEGDQRGRRPDRRRHRFADRARTALACTSNSSRTCTRG